MDYYVDPDEAAEAMREAMVYGGASEAEANVEAELMRVQTVAFNEIPDDQRWTLQRVDPIDVEWAAFNTDNSTDYDEDGM